MRDRQVRDRQVDLQVETDRYRQTGGPTGRDRQVRDRQVRDRLVRDRQVDLQVETDR